MLNGEDIKDQILKMIEGAITSTVKRYMPENVPHEEWSLTALRDHYKGWLIGEEELQYSSDELDDLTEQDVILFLREKAFDLYEEREKMFGEKICRELERVVLLKNVDALWMDHIDAMEELKRGIRLRAYANRDPVVEYRLEGFDMFDEMIAAIRENTARMMLTVRLRTREEPKREEVAKPTDVYKRQGAEIVY